MQLSRVLLLLQAAPALGAGSQWVYANPGDSAANSDAQEATWGGLCTAGHEQSPINIVTTATAKTATPKIETYFDTTAEYVKNTGHGFQLFETKPEASTWNSTANDVDMVSGTDKGYSIIGGAKYNFYQVHWHTPSENTIDGVSYPLEAHFVHQLDDPALHGTLHNLAVIGLMYELGDCNPFLEKFWGDFPTGAAGSAQYTGSDNLDLNAKLSAELSEGYYHWYGSLTTPPCTEGVSWNLLKTVETVCQAQVDSLTAALRATQDGIGFNNRVPQPLNHRYVAETGSGADFPARPVNDVVLEPQGNVPFLYADAGDTEASATAQERTWKGLCATGHEQSPIDIVTADVKEAGDAVISTQIDTTLTYVKNTGHGFQIFETSPSASRYTNGQAGVDDTSPSAKGFSTIAGDKYNFYQAHWHTPSENTVDGVSFPMEVHFVHQLADADLHNSYHRLAVIGLLYETGTADECNEFLDYFWSVFPMTKTSAEYTGPNIDLNAKLSEELAHGYYHWYGSLTTPPCTEGVSWNLLVKTEKVCSAQVEHLATALETTQNGIGFNNRVTQPLNHRVVTRTRSTVYEASSASRHGMWAAGLLALLLPLAGAA